MRIKNLTFTVFAIFCSTLAFGQTEQDIDDYRDTVIIKHFDNRQYIDIDTLTTNIRPFNKVLAGTTVLPRHVSYMQSGFGLYLENVKLTNCDNDEGYYETPTKINSVLLTDSTLTVEFNFMSNCCYDFLCYLDVENDEILKLDFIEYGADCACYCPFKLKYLIHINREYETDFSKLKYIMIRDDRDTMVELKNNN